MSECVKVIVRCRPMNSKEKNLNCAKIISIDQNILQVCITKPQILGSELAAGKKQTDKTQTDATDYEPKRFTFDGVYDDDSTQQEVYEDTAYPLLQSVFDGYNGTIFAYGQTGCGKTFTMEGVRTVPQLRGIIPTTFAQVFSHMASLGAPGRQFLVRASYIEIYNEEVRDLTSDNPKLRCEVKEDKDKGVYIKGLIQAEVKSEQELEALMAKGNSNRTVGATLMNADSSRSHSIFCITVEVSEPDAVKGDGEVKIRQGKLNLVDLAGSERQGKTQAEGVRLKEATKINLSLSALGNVIEALVANAGGKQRHIPYRDSKLTRLLQDSLGGNTKTIMIAAISPADYNFDETLSTLRYANRAKNIKNKPKVNEDPKDALLKEYQDEIKQLKLILQEKGLGDLLAGLKVGGGGGGGGEKKGGKAKEVVKVLTDAGEAKAAELEEELERLEEEKAKHERMKRVIDYEMQQQHTDAASLQHEVSQLDERIAREQENGSAEVVELLKAEKERLVEEEQSRVKDTQEVKLKMESEKAEHDAMIGALEAEMKAKLVEEEERRRAIEDKLLFMTEQTKEEKEVLERKLKGLEEKLLVGSGEGEGRDREVREMREKEQAMKRRQAELEQERQQREEEALFIQEQYDTVQEENAATKKKLHKIACKYRTLEDERARLEDELEEERAGRLRDVKQGDKQLKLYQQICQAILTSTDLERIVTHSTWSEGRDEWKLPAIDLPLVFPTIQIEKPKPDVREGWRRPDQPVSQWQDRFVPGEGVSRYYKEREGGEGRGWKREGMSQLSSEELSRMARARKVVKDEAPVTAEEALRRSRLMSEQIHAITAQVKRRDRFEPVKVVEEKEQKDVGTVIETVEGQVKKRPAFTPAKIVTTSGSGGAGVGLPDSVYSVPMRPAFSPGAQPVSPMSPQSAGVDFNNLPKGRPAFTPAKIG